MIGAARAAAVGTLLAAASCTAQPAGTTPPVSLHNTWMLGVEAMRGDAAPRLPFTNRLIADLTAMPNLQVVFIGDPRNRALFDAWTGGKVTVSPWLHQAADCMTITYTVSQHGQQGGLFGLVVPALPAGQEPDSACVDRAATRFYQDLAKQGL